MKIWTVKIGDTEDFELPDGADWPMRQAIKDAYRSLTGREPQFCFSGWGGQLDAVEGEVVSTKTP